MDNGTMQQSEPNLMDLFLANLFRYIEPPKGEELGRAKTTATRLPLLLGKGFKFPVPYDLDNGF